MNTREVFPTSFRGVVTEKLPAMPRTSWAELDVVFVGKMVYFWLRFWNWVDATPKIAFNQTVLLSISAEGRLNEWNLIRSPNVLPLTGLPPSERAPELPGRCARSEAPKLRNLLAALCSLLSPESALVTRFSLLLLQTVTVTSFLLIRICHCFQNLFQLLLKLSKIPVFRCY